LIRRCVAGRLQTARCDRLRPLALARRRTRLRQLGGVPPLGSIIDLHTHTEVGSFDSKTTIDDHRLTPQPAAPQLDGVAFTEHVHRWTDEALAKLPANLLVFNEREFDNYQGHIVILGRVCRRSRGPTSANYANRSSMAAA